MNQAFQTIGIAAPALALLLASAPAVTQSLPIDGSIPVDPIGAADAGPSSVHGANGWIVDATEGPD